MLLIETAPADCMSFGFKGQEGLYTNIMQIRMKSFISFKLCFQKYPYKNTGKNIFFIAIKNSVHFYFFPRQKRIGDKLWFKVIVDINKATKLLFNSCYNHINQLTMHTFYRRVHLSSTHPSFLWLRHQTTHCPKTILYLLMPQNKTKIGYHEIWIKQSTVKSLLTLFVGRKFYGYTW